MSAAPVFNLNFEPRHGVLTEVSPLVRRLVAPNAGPFTAWGTGTYVVGRGRVAIIDPGPDDESHVEALLVGLSGEVIETLVVTHTHLDHSPAAATIRARLGTPTVGCAAAPTHTDSAEAGWDESYAPDRILTDGETISGSGWTLTAVATPGHTSNHLCYGLAEERALFTGDHVMGWSTTVVAPPDGDMQSYIASLRKLCDRDDLTYYPTHGAPVTNPQQYVESLVAHRLQREAQIIKALTEGEANCAELVKRIYVDLDPRLVHAATRTVLAHAIKLWKENRLALDAGLNISAENEHTGQQPPSTQTRLRLQT
jgi:glyoxylase-like metal-dependent hydrolase (beta-lactamase superfamily II)